MNRYKPNAIKNVIPYKIDDPFGIDITVKSLQILYEEFSWLEKSFARAIIRSEKRKNQAGTEFNYIFPGMFSRVGDDVYDYLNMMELDNYDAYSFFLALDTEDSIDYEELQNQYRRRLDNIVWLNLEKVDSTKGYDYLEEIKQDVRNKVKENRFGTIEIVSIEDEPEAIFREFSLETTDTQFLYYPYRGFRMIMNVTYDEPCGEVSTPVDPVDSIVAIVGNSKIVTS